MSSATLSQIPGLSRLLLQCRRLVRLQAVLRGFAETIATGSITLLLACLLDYLLLLPSTPRLLLLLVTISTCVIVFIRRLLLPAIRTLPAEELGAAVDLQFPDLQEALATLASLSRPDISPDESGSDLMRQLLKQRTSQKLAQIRPGQVVPGQKTIRRSLQAAACLLAIFLPLTLWPDSSQLLARRLLTPFANLAAPTNLWFEITLPQQVAAVGSDVTFAATPRWRTAKPGTRPQQVTLELQTQDGRFEQISMSWNEAELQYTTVLSDARQSLQYRVSGGGAFTEWHTLTVAESPRILAATLTETPPAWTRRPVQMVDGITGEVFVFEDSQIRMQLQFNKPIADLQLVWHNWQPLPARTAGSGEEMTPGENNQLLPEELAAAAAGQPMAETPQQASAEPAVPKLQWSPDRLQAELTFAVSGGGRFEFQAHDDVGLPISEPADRRLTAVPDKPPVLQATGIRDGLEVRPDDIVPLNTIATDDIGIGMLELHFRRNQEAFRIQPAEPLETGAEAVAFDFRLDLKTLALQQGDTLELRARTADERPSPGPQTVWQGPWILKVSDTAPPIGLQALQQADRELLEALRKLSQELALDVAKVAQLRAKAQQDLSQKTRDEVRGLSEKEQTQGNHLQDLAEQTAQHPLMQQPADKLAALAQQLRREVAEHLNAAAAAERDPAVQDLQQAENRLQQIRNELDQSAAQMERAAKLEQDLAELNRLALDAEKLADDSLQHQQQRQQGQPAAGQSPEDFQKQLTAEQQRLQGEQQQLDQQLQDLLKKQQELLQAAREAQLDQAAALSKQLEQLAQRQQGVATGVQEEARDAGRDAEQLAGQLQQLQADLQTVMQQLKQQPADSPPPTDSQQPDTARPDPAALDPAALDQAIRDLRQGNLAAPQQALQQTAAQLAEAARQQAQGQPDNTSPSPDSPQQQARQLQQRLQELNRKLQQLAAERTDQPGTQQQATAAMLQQLDQLAQAASQQAQTLQQDSVVSQAAQAAAERSAQRAGDARRSAESGQFQRAAEQLNSAAEEAGEASGQMNAAERQDQVAQLQQQRNDLTRMADSLRQMQSSNPTQTFAQRQTQQDVNQQAGELPQQLNSLSERLNHPALGLQNLARPSQEAAQAAQQAAGSGQQAADSMQQAQLQQAGQAAEQAAGQLSRAGQLAAQAAQGLRDPSNPVPDEVGDSIGEALQNLQQAARRMAQEDSQQPAVPGDAEGSGQSGQPGESGQPGQPGEMGQPQAGEQPQQSGADGQQSRQGQQNASGGQQGSSQDSRQSRQPGPPGSEQGGRQPGQSSAQSLADAAKSLKNAAKNSLPARFAPGQLGSDSSPSSSDPGSRGNAGVFDGAVPDVTVKRGQRRQWGQLQDQLENDVKDGGREVLDSEYSGMIRSYRRNLARSRSTAPERTSGQP